MKAQTLRPTSRFQEFQTEHSLAYELPYWDFVEKTIVLSDGTLVLGLALRGIAIETMDADQINKLTLDYRAFLNGLPDGYEISLYFETDMGYKTLLSEHENLKGKNPLLGWLTDVRVSELKEEIKNKNILKPHLYMFVYKRLEEDRESKSLSFFSNPKYFPSIKKANHEKAEKELHQVTTSILELLSNIGVRGKIMEGEENWDLLYRFLNPTRAKEILAPKVNNAHRTQEFLPGELEIEPALSLPSPREQIIFSDVVQNFDTLFYDGYFHRCISLKTLPEFTHSAFISRLSQLPFPHLFQVHIRVPEQSKELSLLQQKRRMAHSMSFSHNGRATDLENQAKLNSTEELLQELINTGQKIFYFQATLLLRAQTPDELDYQTRTALSKIRELNGAEGIAETVANFKVWKTLLPGGNTNMVRPKRIKTDNLADFLPLYESYDGT